MNKILIKTMIGFLSIGAVTGAGVLAKNYIKYDNQLINTAKVTQKSSYSKNINQEMEQAEEELKEAKEDKEKAEQEVTKAEETISKASKEKEEAILELKKAKTPEERKIAQAKIDATTTKIEKAEEAKKSAEKKVETASKIVEEKEQNKQNIEEKAAEVKENENKQNQTVSTKSTKESESTKSSSNVTSNKSQASTKNNTTTKPKEESEEQGPKYDLNDYPELLDKINKKTKEQEEEIKKEAEKKKVEFHFYSTKKSLPIHCTESYCGDSGHIWFVEVECDLNKCEGFTNSRTGAQVSTLLIGRRADITSYTVTAPAPKYGYRFVGWELISSRKAVSNELGSGVLSGKYIATYEKI